MIYYAKLEENRLTGFYIESFHGKELCESLNHLKIDEELHGYLLDSGSMLFEDIQEDRLYTLEDKALFSKELIEDVTLPPSNEDRLAALEELMMGVL